MQLEPLSMQTARSANFKADLDSTMLGETNSLTCLAQGQCDPLGGHSVVGWLPPSHSSRASLPTTLVIAQMDGIGPMHENIVVSSVSPSNNGPFYQHVCTVDEAIFQKQV